MIRIKAYVDPSLVVKNHRGRVGGTLTRPAHLPAELPAKLPAIRLPQGRMMMDPDGQKPQVKREMDHRPTCLTRKRSQVQSLYRPPASQQAQSPVSPGGAGLLGFRGSADRRTDCHCSTNSRSMTVAPDWM